MTAASAIYREVEAALDRLVPLEWLPGEPEWGVPTLREDMLLSDVPRPLPTWTGTEPIGDSIWLRDFATPNAEKLPLSKTILMFEDDDRADSWWVSPSDNTARLVVGKVHGVIAPSWSMKPPKSNMMYDQYRQQWFARFLQEAGIRVIPSVRVLPEPESVLLLGVPRRAPVLCLWLYVREREVTNDRALLDRYVKSVAATVAALKPKRLLVYGGPVAHVITGRVAVDGLQIDYIAPYLVARTRNV